MSPDDHVAMALEDLQGGETITLAMSERTIEITLKEHIPLCHKFAVVDLGPGTLVRKYGQTIGMTSRAISAGSHVHVHNVVSLRARTQR